MAGTATDRDAYIVFTVAGTSYALPSGEVQHMEMVEQVTPVPHAPPFVDGLVFSRGAVVPVVNLRARFGYERAPYDARTRLLVVRTGDRVVGLLADSAREFVTIPGTAIHPPHEAVQGLSARYLSGVATLGDRMVLVVDSAEIVRTSDGAATAPDLPEASK